MEELKNIIADNLIFYRKTAKLTQLELAEKLNYSDKAISKWECAETIPDIYILTQLANIYGITVNDIITNHVDTKPLPKVKQSNKRILICSLSCGLVWLIATVCFVVLTLCNLNFAWLSFIYAFPISFAVLTIFSTQWFKKKITAIFSSLLIWSGFLTAYLTLNQSNFWPLFLISIPLQVLVILWLLYKAQAVNKK